MKTLTTAMQTIINWLTQSQDMHGNALEMPIDGYVSAMRHLLGCIARCEHYRRQPLDVPDILKDIHDAMSSEQREWYLLLTDIERVLHATPPITQRRSRYIAYALETIDDERVEIRDACARYARYAGANEDAATFAIDNARRPFRNLRCQ
jgi:hypothetical protein